MSAIRLFPAFSVAFALVYIFSMSFNLALFAYYPALAEFHVAAQPSVSGPAMYWYAWLVNSAVGGLLIALAAAAIPKAWTAKIWSGWTWVIPGGVIVAFFVLLRRWFIA